MSLHLITGGCGYVGSRICERLLDRGESVRIIDTWIDKQRFGSVDHIRGNILDEKVLDKAFQGVDFVHHTAALVPLAKAGNYFDEVNERGTELVCNKALEHGVKFVSHMSSSAVFGAPKVMPIDISADRNPLDIYGLSKAKAELKVERAMNSGLKASIIRPRTIIGKGRGGIFEILFQWISDDANIYIIGDGSNLLQFVHIDDLADVSIETALQCKQGYFNVGSSDFKGLRTELEELINYSGSQSKVKSIPAWFAIPSLAFLDKVSLSPLAAWHYKTYHKSFFFDNKHIQERLGISPQYTNIDSLKIAFDDYISRKMDPNSWLMEGSFHKASVKQGILALLKKFG